MEMLAKEVEGNIRSYAVEMLGAEAASLLDALPVALSWSHRQWIEHCLCEVYKFHHPDTRHYDYNPAEGMPSDIYRDLLRRAFPDVAGEVHE